MPVTPSIVSSSSHISARVMASPLFAKPSHQVSSKMRRHAGNVPSLPQTKQCPYCPAKYTRTTHLNRHLKTHTNEGLHKCDACDSQFTRSDLLSRHKKTCIGLPRTGSSRRKSCRACAASKTKCDLREPCGRCRQRQFECHYASPASVSAAASSRLADDAITLLTTSASSSSASPEALTHSSPHDADADALSSVYTPPTSEYQSSAYTFHTGAASAISAGPSADGRGTYSVLQSGNMFDGLFSNIFAEPAPPAVLPEPAANADSPSNSWPFVPERHSGIEFNANPCCGDAVPAFGFMSLGTRHLPDLAEAAGLTGPPPGAVLPGEELHPPSDQHELAHYLYLFYTEFLVQMPIMHPNFSPENKTPVLVAAMRACGALYVRTRKAADFVNHTLAAARAQLPAEFAKDPKHPGQQIHLVLAVLLLQTIGLFHHSAEERELSHVYHGMLVKFMRHTGLFQRNEGWMAPELDSNTNLEATWRVWSLHEMAKRAMWLTYLHDTCHPIYFCIPSSFREEELIIMLPCEQRLWETSSALEWFARLNEPSPCGTMRERMEGVRFPVAMRALRENRKPIIDLTLTPFGHFITVHALLRDLYAAIPSARTAPAPSPVSSSAPSPASDGSALSPSSSESDHSQPEPPSVFDVPQLQLALHNWLQTWTRGPETPQTSPNAPEPPFLFHSLPYYWLAQVSLMAHDESMPPFQIDSLSSTQVEARFRLVKGWVKHIRVFLKNEPTAPTLYWDEMMKIRLQSWRVENEDLAREEQDEKGMLTFFSNV